MSTKAEGIIWNLSELYESQQSPSIEKDIDEIRSAVDKIVEDFNTLWNNDASPEQWKELFEKLEETYEKAGRIVMYAYLLLSENTANQQANKLFTRAQEISSEIQNKLVPHRLKLAQLSDEKYEKLFSSDVLSNYRHFVDKERKSRRFLLPEGEELSLIHI